MNTKLVAFISVCAVVGAFHADALTLTVTPYDFNSLLVSGTGVGDATMTINGAAATTTKLGADELLATGLSAGNVYTYAVTLGGNTTNGEVTMGNGTGKLFGADATSGTSQLTPQVTCDETAPYVAPTVDANKYVLQGASNKFNVASSLMSGKKIVYIDSTMIFDEGADELDENLSALGAFTLAQLDETSDAYSWVGLTGGTTKWVTLTGFQPAPGTYVSRMEFDFNASPANVRYLVGSSASDLTVLKDGSGNEWFPVAADSAAVSSVAFEGTGSYTKLEGSSINANVAVVDGTEYATIAAALTSQMTGATVKLLTNTRPEANAALVGGSWTIMAGDYGFRPSAATGYDYSYQNNTFTVSQFQTRVTVGGSTAMGCDYTNGTLTVSLSDCAIQSGAPVSATVTVKDSSGDVVATKEESGINGDRNIDLNVPTAGHLAVYTYEVAVTKDDGATPVATYCDSFVAGNRANWFSADASNWTNHGTWSTNGVAVTVEGAMLPLEGNQYDFTPTAPSISNVLVRVDTVIEVDAPIGYADLPQPGTVTQGMITLAETSVEDTTAVWKALVGNEWKALTGGTTSAGTYTVRAEFDYTDSANKRVRYSVAKSGEPFVVLKDGENEWIANGDQKATTLNVTSAFGVGNLVSLKGDNIDAFIAEVDGVKYESLADALAVAGDKDVKLLWDCTWNPTVGEWRINRNDKSLIINAADGIFVSEKDGLLRVNDVAVAKIGETRYGFLDQAFAEATANATVQMLTNVVQTYDVAAPNAVILDLAGSFVKIAEGKVIGCTAGQLTITNSSEEVGGFNGSFSQDSSYVIKGGKWAANTDTHIAENYQFAPLAETETVDGVCYAFEAIAAKVYPVVGDGVKAIVPDAFVKEYIGEGKTEEEVSTALNAPRTEGNKMPLIQCYVLSLDPNKPTDVPVVASEQIAEPDKVKVSLGDTVKVNPAAGVTVKYSLSTANNTAFTGEGATTSEPQTTSEFEADVPNDGSKVKYYKINIHFSNDE